MFDQKNLILAHGRSLWDTLPSIARQSILSIENGVLEFHKEPVSEILSEKSHKREYDHDIDQLLESLLIRISHPSGEVRVDPESTDLQISALSLSSETLDNNEFADIESSCFCESLLKLICENQRARILISAIATSNSTRVNADTRGFCCIKSIVKDYFFFSIVSYYNICNLLQEKYYF